MLAAKSFNWTNIFQIQDSVYFYSLEENVKLVSATDKLYEIQIVSSIQKPHIFITQFYEIVLEFIHFRKRPIIISCDDNFHRDNIQVTQAKSHFIM